LYFNFIYGYGIIGVDKEYYKKVTSRNGKYSEEMKKKKEQFYIDFMKI
jgi:hypothetical protein